MVTAGTNGWGIIAQDYCHWAVEISWQSPCWKSSWSSFWFGYVDLLQSMQSMQSHENPMASSSFLFQTERGISTADLCFYN